MKPPELRRDAYTWQQIADSAARLGGGQFSRRPDIGPLFNSAAVVLGAAAQRMAALADELEARNAS